MISIIIVNFDSYDFLEILIKSLFKFSSLDHEIIVVDNSNKKKTLEYSNVFFYPQESNIGHGDGMNFGLTKATSEYVLFLDVDCHLLKCNFDQILINLNVDIVTAPGVISKPLRPAFLFGKKEIFKNYNFKPTFGYKGNRITPDGYDVGILAYYQMLKENREIFWLNSIPNRYKTLNGEEWCVNDIPIVYHHWHGSHLKERQVDFSENLIDDKISFFEKVKMELDY